MVTYPLQCATAFTAYTIYIVIPAAKTDIEQYFDYLNALPVPKEYFCSTRTNPLSKKVLFKILCDYYRFEDAKVYVYYEVFVDVDGGGVGSCHLGDDS